MGYLILGQVINRVGEIADFGHKESKGFGKQATHPHPIFLEVTPGYKEPLKGDRKDGGGWWRKLGGIRSQRREDEDKGDCQLEGLKLPR